MKIVSQKRDNTEDKIIAISCQLICKNGKSDLIPLSDCLSQSEERLKVTCDSQAPGDTISIIIVKDDLGPLVAVAFYPDASHTGAWFMSYVMAVYQGGNPELFPAYKWLQRGDELVVTSQTCKCLLLSIVVTHLLSCFLGFFDQFNIPYTSKISFVHDFC